MHSAQSVQCGSNDDTELYSSHNSYRYVHKLTASICEYMAYRSGDIHAPIILHLPAPAPTTRPTRVENKCEMHPAVSVIESLKWRFEPVAPIRIEESRLEKLLSLFGKKDSKYYIVVFQAVLCVCAFDRRFHSCRQF